MSHVMLAMSLGMREEAEAIAEDLLRAYKGVIEAAMDRLPESMSPSEALGMLCIIWGQAAARIVYGTGMATSLELDGVSDDLRPHIVAAGCANVCGHMITRMPTPEIRTEAVSLLRVLLDEYERIGVEDE